MYVCVVVCCTAYVHVCMIDYLFIYTSDLRCMYCLRWRSCYYACYWLYVCVFGCCSLCTMLIYCYMCLCTRLAVCFGCMVTYLIAYVLQYRVFVWFIVRVMFSLVHLFAYLRVCSCVCMCVCCCICVCLLYFFIICAAVRLFGCVFVCYDGVVVLRCLMRWLVVYSLLLCRVVARLRDCPRVCVRRCVLRCIYVGMLFVIILACVYACCVVRLCVC